MKITAWRITKALYAEKAFAGLGAWLEGARWNPKGVYMVYTAESIALAALEMLVHLPEESLLYQHYVKIPVEFDAEQITVFKRSALPPNWNANPPEETTQQLGADWVASRESLVLKVPSSVIPEESNYLINPVHPDFKSVDIGPAQSFLFDRRLGAEGEKGRVRGVEEPRGRVKIGLRL